MSGNFIGRRVAVGVGVETVRGTAVAPAYWIRHLSLDFSQKAKKIQNVSAMNRMEEVNGAALTEQWADGKLEGKVGDFSIGYLLLNMFGSVSSAAEIAPNALAFDHTFTIAQTNTPPTMTIVRTDANSNRRHAFGTLKNLEINCGVGEYVKVNGELVALKGTTGIDTVAFIQENEFTSKHISAKIAADLASIPGATDIKASNLKLKIDRKAEPYFAFNSTDPANVFVGSYAISGEITLTYDDTVYEDLFTTNATKYMQIAITNTDVVLATSANPKLVFNIPQARISDWGMSNDLDKVIEQTVSFTAEFNVTASAAITAVLTNVKTNYTS
jgi:hypothetical protein